MKRIFKILTITAMFMSAAPAMAQMNIGHCNTDSVLVLMPEYKTAMAELQNLQTQFENEIAEMRSELEVKAQSIETNSATWTPLRVQKEQSELQTSYNRLQNYAQQAQQDLGAKEQELLTPVLQKLQEAINAVGTEKGLDYILDSSRGRGTVIFKKESRDISNAVKTKLGIL